MKEPGRKAKKIVKIVLIGIMCYMVVCFASCMSIILMIRCCREDPKNDYGLFQYIVVRDRESDDPDAEAVAIVGFTASGRDQTEIDIPREIDGRPVKHIGYQSHEELTLMGSIYYRLESYELEKLYIHDNIISIENLALYKLPDVEIMYCADTFDMSVEGVSHTNRIYLYRSLYETMVPETSDRYFPANVEFMNNYSDEVNGGYYRLDNIDEGEILSRPPKPEREGYKFTDWYTEPECANAWGFNESPAIEEGTAFRLYAGWRKS